MPFPFSNDFLFKVRRKIPRLRRGPYQEKLKEFLEQEDIPLEKAKQLSAINLRVNLFYLWILRQVPLFLVPETKGSIMDLGSMHFPYAIALREWLRPYFKEIKMRGLEVDPYPIYWNLFKREDSARYYAKIASDERAEVKYEQGNWLDYQLNEPVDIMTCFFPFLFSDLSDRSRLPREAFRPLAFYEKCFQSGKRVIFFHQGKEEREESLRLIRKLRMGKIIFHGSFKENPWLKRKETVEVLLWQKTT